MFNSMFKKHSYSSLGASPQPCEAPSDDFGDWESATGTADANDHLIASGAIFPGDALQVNDNGTSSTSLEGKSSRPPRATQTSLGLLTDVGHPPASSVSNPQFNSLRIGNQGTAALQLSNPVQSTNLLDLFNETRNSAADASSKGTVTNTNGHLLDWEADKDTMTSAGAGATSGVDDSLICFDSPKAGTSNYCLLDSLGTLDNSNSSLAKGALTVGKGSTEALAAENAERTSSSKALYDSPANFEHDQRVSSSVSTSETRHAGSLLDYSESDSPQSRSGTLDTPLADLLKSSHLADPADNADYDVVPVYVVPLFRGQFVVIPTPTDPPRQKPKPEWVQNIQQQTTKVQQKVQSTWDSLKHSEPDSIKSKIHRFGTAQLEDLTPEQRFLGGIPQHARLLRVIHSSKVDPQVVLDYMTDTVKRLGTQQRFMQIGAAAALPFTFAIDSIVLPGPAILTGLTGYKLYHYTRAAEGSRYLQKFIDFEDGPVAGDESRPSGEIEFVVDERLDKYHDYVLDADEAVLEEDCIADLSDDLQVPALNDILQQLRRRHLRKRGKNLL